MNTTAGISVIDVCKSFDHAGGAVRALANVSFHVAPGQFVSIVGPSGCGKSTLLQMLAGLAKPTTGEIRLNDVRIDGPVPSQIGVVFQEALLLPWKTAIENVEFPLRLKGVAAGAARERARERLDLVGLGDAADRFPHELSGGMRQRVAIARGLVQEPSVLLMDEPFGALDEQTRMRMGDELLKIWERSRPTVVFITHSLVEAVFLSDVVYVMAAKPGRILDRIEVPITRPRSIDVVDSSEFGALRNRMWHLIADPH